MNKTLIILLLLAFPFITKAQFNPEAANIIKSVSDNILSSNGVEIEFVFTFNNKQEDISETNTGKAALKGNMYKLSMMDVVSYFNGTTQWILMTDEQEVNITEPDAEDEEEFTPVNIFKMYEKGFRFKIIEESGDLVTIDMIPDDVKKPFHKIRITVNKAQKTFLMVKSFGRDGTDNTIDITITKKDLNLSDDFFVFKATDYPDVDIIDMR